MQEDHAQFISDQYESGNAEVKQAKAKRDRMATVIQDLLATAELAAKRGDEAGCDEAIAKASALQLKHAIDDAMLARTGGAGSDKIDSAEFCTESNTPLIKAKRQLINTVAHWNRGRAVMMGEMRDSKTKGRRWDRRAKIKVWAHDSDLRFIGQLYTSLLLQMQSMMANDEHQLALRVGAVRVTNAWRVSYAYGYVDRVAGRLAEADQLNNRTANASAPGTALVLRDRQQLVVDHVDGIVGRTRKTGYRIDDRDSAGRAAGYVAGGNADLGGTKVSGSATRRIEA